MLWRWIVAMLGAALVMFTLREVFRDLFHPTRTGSLSSAIGTTAYRLVQRFPGVRSSVGPLALVSVVFLWVLLIGLGFALVYFGSFPAGLAIPGEGNLGLGQQFLRCAYLSLGSLDTFQTFDLNARPAWLRLVIGMEGLIGFSMITASVSWTVLLYPALARTRWLARRVLVFLEARERSGMTGLEDSQLLIDLTRNLIELRIDLTLFPIMLSFFPADPDQTLAANLPHLVDLAKQGLLPQQAPGTRFAAAQLDVALDHFRDLLVDRVLAGNLENADRAEVFRRFREREA